MIQFIKRIKFIYILYNFFHRKKLKHNLPAFKKLGIQKKYYSSLSSRDFTELNKEPDKEENAPIESQLNSPENNLGLTEKDRSSILNFEKEGYAIIRNF
jgi:hypothetical protein